MQKLGSGATFYNVSFVGSKALSDALGKDGVGVAISQVVPFPWGTAVPVVKEYQAASKSPLFRTSRMSRRSSSSVGRPWFICTRGRSIPASRV